MAKHWLKDSPTGTGESRDLYLEASPAQPTRSGWLDWWRLFLLRRRINALLRRTVGPLRHEDASRLSPHILRDIGLQPPM